MYKLNWATLKLHFPPVFIHNFLVFLKNATRLIRTYLDSFQSYSDYRGRKTVQNRVTLPPRLSRSMACDLDQEVSRTRSPPRTLRECTLCRCLMLYLVSSVEQSVSSEKTHNIYYYIFICLSHSHMALSTHTYITLQCLHVSI